MLNVGMRYAQVLFSGSVLAISSYYRHDMSTTFLCIIFLSCHIISAHAINQALNFYIFEKYLPIQNEDGHAYRQYKLLLPA